MWGCGCQQLEDIPAHLGWERAAAARGSRAADDLPGALIPGESLEDDGTADHVASKANGTLTILHAHRTVCGEAAVAPGEEVGDHLLGDEIAAEKYAQQFGPEEFFSSRVAGDRAVARLWRVVPGQDEGFHPKRLLREAICVRPLRRRRSTSAETQR